MKRADIKIDIEIYIVFIVLIGVSVFNAIYSTITLSKNQDASNQIMTVDVPSMQALENMNLLVTQSKMYTTNWVHLQSDKPDKEKLKVLQDNEYPELRKKLVSLMSFWNDPENEKNLKNLFNNFDVLIINEKQIMSSLVRFDDYEDPMKKFGAVEILENQVLPQSSAIMAQLDHIIAKRKVIANYSHDQMKSSSDSLMLSLLILAVLIVVIVLISGFYVSNSIVVPVMKLRSYILQMGQGELPEIRLTVKRSNAVGQMTEAVKTLRGSLAHTAKFANSIGEGDFKAEFQPLSENDEFGNALIQMRERLSEADQANRLRHWEASGIAEINRLLHEHTNDIEKLSDELIKTLAATLEVSSAGFYLIEEHNDSQSIRLKGGYALPENVKEEYSPGQGYVGQAIRGRQSIHISNIPGEYMQISSGIGNISSASLLVVPIMHQGIIYGAIEMASFHAYEPFKISFLERVGEIIGSVIASSIANSLTKKLLEETQHQATQLKRQEEALRNTNEELAGQSQLLQASREELKQSNKELKVKAELLQSQNETLEQAREALSVKAKELEAASKYKSEFLANMSHELRTPLNSVLILAKLLMDNKNKNLNEKESEYARVIHKSGSDLLSLINEILDLSKIEAGKIEMVMQDVAISRIEGNMLDLFSPIVNEKKIEFRSEIQPELPKEFVTDQFRLEQVLKNLLSNAMKFTGPDGKVTLKIRQVRSANHNGSAIEFAVQDTGIGIRKEQQKGIFDAFQQADSSISRKYGGTGLGLSISKMLVSILGGEMHLQSEEGKGSIFSIVLPLNQVKQKKEEQIIQTPEIKL